MHTNTYTYTPTPFKQYTFDMKKTWAVLSEILNRNSRNTVPDNVIINGVECSDKQAIVKHFNSFFRFSWRT